MKHTCYVNILKEWNKDELFFQSELWQSENDAKKLGSDAITDSLEIVATCKVEWLDGCPYPESSLPLKFELMEWAINGIKMVMRESFPESDIAKGAIAVYEDLIEKLNSM